MAEARIPENDEERLKALHSYGLLDNHADPAFDHIIRIAADVCETEISVIALIDRERQYFFARNGMKPRETPRAIAFCAHAILEPHVTFEIPDARQDPRFVDNPLVTGEIGVRFYAAQPLTTDDGLAIGGLCLIGKKPKNLNQVQRETLQRLGGVIMAMFESRKDAIAAEKELIAHRDHLQKLVDEATSELKIKAEELERSLARQKELNELQRQFVSMASHEFRTPLAIIDSTAHRMKNLAERDDLTSLDAAARVEKIQVAVKRMTRLMESTLMAARMDDGKIAIDAQPCDIGPIVTEICMRQQEIAPNHVISCELGKLPATIQADTTALEQALGNLLSNAIKYAPDAPLINVSAHASGDHVVIAVMDRGLGIDAEDLPRIGERFFRARTSVGIAGTGIGLNVAKILIEEHGGTLGVVSERGKGSTFTIVLPVAGPQQTGLAGAGAA
jgi:signal transduction histidine kinase